MVQFICIFFSVFDENDHLLMSNMIYYYYYELHVWFQWSIFQLNLETVSPCSLMCVSDSCSRSHSFFFLKDIQLRENSTKFKQTTSYNKVFIQSQSYTICPVIALGCSSTAQKHPEKYVQKIQKQASGRVNTDSQTLGNSWWIRGISLQFATRILKHIFINIYVSL